MPEISKKKLNPIPRFKNFKEENDFWRTHNLNDYVVYKKRRKVVYHKNLEKNLTVRFSLNDFVQLKKIAAKRGIGITTFIRFLTRAYLAKLPHSV